MFYNNVLDRPQKKHIMVLGMTLITEALIFQQPFRKPATRTGSITIGYRASHFSLTLIDGPRGWM